jgi:amidase
MKRRTFLQNSAVVTLAGYTGFSVLQACGSKQRSDEGIVVKSGTEDFQLSEMTVDDLRMGMESGKFTAREITQQYLNRIAEVDKNGPSLNAIVEINPDALALAESLDQERKDNKVRGPLHGIPILIKDNIDTGDRMMTTAGSRALEGHLAQEDATIVKQLREAGAILLGKTNLSEWANFRSTRSSSGWSSRGGQVRNPYALDRSPCGSSSGSGAAVAANLCAVAIGTETNGSIICPSSINGIVGLKPTVGLWSRTGIIPISHTQDTAGPMTRTVADAAILLGALTAVDKSDQATAKRPQSIPADYTVFLKGDNLEGKTIGVEESFMKGHEAIDGLLAKALDQMRSKGAKIVTVDFLSRFKNTGKDEFDVLKFEFKDGLNRYLASHQTQMKSLADIIAFNTKHEEQVMPFFKQEILIDSEAKEGLESQEYKEALNRLLTTTRNAFAEIFRAHKLDALCGPANGPSWCIDLINGDSFTGYGMYSSAAIAGYPSITVPMGMVSGLPVGLCFCAEAYQEPQLLEIAFAYETISRHRTPPTFPDRVGVLVPPKS